MVTVRDVDQSALVKRAAQDLKKKISMPDWARFVKTGVQKERPPEQDDWWYVRAASVLRNVYLHGPVGVERLRTVYGGKKSLGHQPTHFRKASGKVIRVILQDLERAKLIESVSKPRRGRKITREGQRFLDNIAKEIKV
ncbi:MAG: 30S ribosomal protein S19e [Candidatus Aenigmatarchaeota archaeon]